VRFRRQWSEERGGNIIERFETLPWERVKIGGDRKRDRSGPIKYNYFPIEWKLFGNVAIDDIHTFIKRFSDCPSALPLSSFTPSVLEYLSVPTLTSRCNITHGARTLGRIHHFDKRIIS